MRVSLRPMALTILLTSFVVAPAFAQQPLPGSTSPKSPPQAADTGAPKPPDTGAPKPAAEASGTITVYPECKTTPPTEAESEAAHGAYLAGKGSFDEADYITAVTYFRDAYRRDCTKHELLSALARAYELKGDRAEAINALETYLRRAPPNAPGNDAVQRRLVALKAQTLSALPSSQAPTASPIQAPAASLTKAQDASPERHKPAQYTIYPWIVAGGGVLLAVGGVSLWAIGTSQVNQSKDDATAAGCHGTQCPAGVDTKAFQDKNDSGSTKRGIGIALVGVGAAAVAGGLVWHFLEPKMAHTRKVQARPDLAPGYAGLSLGGAF